MTAPPYRPRLEAVHFGDEVYERMARVLELTARLHNPNWHINVRQVEPREYIAHPNAEPWHIQNTQKMDEWNRIVQDSEDGDDILLIDADTFVLHSLSPIWWPGWDVCITTDIDLAYPFNTGVVAVRSSKSVRDWFNVWWMVQQEMLHRDWAEYRFASRVYGGINASALGTMLTRYPDPTVRIARAPCEEWNCHWQHWDRFNRHSTRVVHLNPPSKNLFFQNGQTPAFKKVHDLWTELEADA